jgi:hypothetical protein
LARKATEILVVEVKAVRGPITMSMINQVLAYRTILRMSERQVNAALVVPASSLGLTALTVRHAVSLGIAVYFVERTGDVRPVVDPPG